MPSPPTPPALPAKSGRATTTGRATVGKKFVKDVDRLIGVLQAANQHYVRCVKSNADKNAATAAWKFDAQTCYTQLLYVAEPVHVGGNTWWPRACLTNVHMRLQVRGGVPGAGAPDARVPDPHAT